VIRTRVGYAGGAKVDPTCYDFGDHSEAVQMDYDPSVISYEELLVVFWDSHCASSPSYSRQYASRVFYRDDSERQAAEASAEKQQEALGKKIYTDIELYSNFYPAEDYHQKYALRQTEPYIGEMLAIYPTVDDLRDSTAAAKLNGFVYGYGDLLQVEALLPDLGLSAEAQETLLKRFKR